MTVPDKPTSPAQQYRMTDKGRAAIVPDGNRQVGSAVEGEGKGQVEGQEGQAALSAKEIAMLRASLDGAVAAEALIAAAGHSSRSGHFRRCINRLLHDGLLEMTVPGRPRNPAQNYRLTDKGRAALRRAAEGHKDFGA